MTGAGALYLSLLARWWTSRCAVSLPQPYRAGVPISTSVVEEGERRR